MMAIDESQAMGVKLKAACAMINMGVRTIQRWRIDRDAEDMRMGPKTEPANKLCKRERAWVLEVMNQPAYRDLPPSQIVPKLADCGVFVASESTMQRQGRDGCCQRLDVYRRVLMSIHHFEGRWINVCADQVGGPCGIGLCIFVHSRLLSLSEGTSQLLRRCTSEF